MHSPFDLRSKFETTIESKFKAAPPSRKRVKQMVEAPFAVELGAVSARSRHGLVLDLDSPRDMARSGGVFQSDDPRVA